MAQKVTERIRQSDPIRRQARPYVPSQITKRLDAPTIAALIADYEAGTSTNQLVIKYKISKGSVIRLLHKHGTEMRYQGLSPEQLEQAIEHYMAGLSCERVAAELGSNAKTIWDALTKAGVPMRDTHGQDR